MPATDFLTDDQAKSLAATHSTPLYVYSKAKILEQAKAMLDVEAPYGLTVRYAMKANPHPEILRLLREKGVKIDASSGYETLEALDAGYEPSDVYSPANSLRTISRNLLSAECSLTPPACTSSRSTANFFQAQRSVYG